MTEDPERTRLLSLPNPTPRRRERRLHTISLRRRVTLVVLGVLAIVLIGVVVVVAALFSAQSKRDVAAVLTNRVQVAQKLSKQNTAPVALVRQVQGAGVRASLTMPDGQKIGDSPEQGTSRTVRLNGGRTAGATLTLTADPGVLAREQSRLLRLLIYVGLAALAVTAVALVLTVRVALAPLDTMTLLARSIASGGRGRRLSPRRTDTELGRTALAFDDMLDALEGAEASAQASEERTRRFVADAAHELRTPIAGIQAVAEAVAQLRPDASAEERSRLETLLVRESRRAGQLVSDLLALARIDAGLELVREPVDLLALAVGEADRTRLLAPELSVTVSGDPVTVPGDSDRLTQVLANLMDNARQAAPPDGQISVSVGVDGPFGVMTVMDSGPGVPEADRDRIFDRLVRLDDARDRRSGGSGLGLAIARGFARAHGGELSCESGSVFRLLLPLGV